MSVLPTQTRSCVVLDLEASWEEQRAMLKRNLRESLRRTRNRIKRLDGRGEVRVVGAGPEWPSAVAELARLHRMRATAPGRVVHADLFADPDTSRLMTEAAAALPPGALEIAFLELDGRAIGAHATIRSPGTTYLLMSGLDPAWWDVGAVTELIGEIARAAIERGDTRLNLSTGPDRGQDALERAARAAPRLHLVGDRPRSRALGAAYCSLSVLRRLSYEAPPAPLAPA